MFQDGRVLQSPVVAQILANTIGKLPCVSFRYWRLRKNTPILKNFTSRGACCPPSLPPYSWGLGAPQE